MGGKADPDLDGLNVGREPGRYVRFAGRLMKADSVIYIADCSGSMVATFADVWLHVIRSLESLDDSHKFQIFLTPNREPVPAKLELATAQKKKEKIEYLSSVRARGTDEDLLPLLRRAFEVARKAGGDNMVVFFISDGVLTEEPDKLLKAIRGLNVRSLIRLHTVHVGDSEVEGETLLRRMAEENGGEYIRIRP